MQTLLIILGAYLLYKFVTDFVIPIYRTTKKVQEQFRNMQENSRTNNVNSNRFNSSPVNHANHAAASKDSSKEYIEFEEIKD